VAESQLRSFWSTLFTNKLAAVTRLVPQPPIVSSPMASGSAPSFVASGKRHLNESAVFNPTRGVLHLVTPHSETGQTDLTLTYHALHFLLAPVRKRSGLRPHGARRFWRGAARIPPRRTALSQHAGSGDSPERRCRNCM